MLRSATLLAAAGLALAPTGTSQNVPTNFVIDTIVSSGLNAPMDFSFLADERVLVANRAGPVSIYAGTNAVTIGTVPSVQSGGERGLLSIEPDPNFATNGYIYVYFSSSQTSAMHLERYTCTGDLSNPASTNVSFSAASRRVILNTLPDVAFNHNGGTCRFGPDGMLYLTVGDDANACTAQNQNSKSGCLLRMDVSGLGTGSGTSEPSYNSIDPGNNPNSASNSFNQLVVAYGLRNPFRMDIDQMTGNVYIGDVGLSTAEEYSEYVFNAASVTLVNFGWPWREGLSPGPTGCGGSQPGGLTDPIAAVTSGSWNSVMGGPRYRNQGQPFDLGANYEGDCFFSDFYSGELRRIKFNGTSWAPAPSVPGQSGANWGTGFNSATSMRVGPDGGLWFCQNTSQSPSTGGSLERIRSLGPTNSVTAISGGDQIGPAGEAYSQPLVVQVLDTSGQPLPGGTVNFSVTGGHTLSTTNPVIADASGFAQTSVTASTITGGAFTVTGSTPGSQTNAGFPMFSRKMNVTGIVGASTLLVLSVVNQTDAVPAQIPYIVFMSFPGSPTLPTSIGPICTDPTYALTVALEDGVGSFGGISFSGTGAIGTPSKSWVYQGIPNFLLTGFNMSFQTVGYDPLTGWFRTNCELEQF